MCPALQQAQIVSQSATLLRTQVRKLHRLQVHCQACPYDGACQPMNDWRNLIETAITQTYRELTGTSEKRPL
jgi:hypothetical protein